ncbi:MAG TPA: membrane-bound lytic murein transglycosylase MltF [Thiobacillaceae bacterium]|nr:membrane-bound lytic murein transglycosylase MltF [Thiobacillaceae bacterium]
MLILFPALWLAGCSKPAPDPSHSAELIVATRNSPTAYFINEQDQPAGYAYDLISLFAEQHGWKVRWQVSPDLTSMYTLAKQAQVNIVAAELTEQAVRHQGLRPGPALFISRALVISRQGGPPISKAADLVGKKIAVLAEGGHAELMQALQRKNPKLTWKVLPEAWPEELLSRLSDGEFDAVVVNETDFDRARLYYPGLIEAFTLADYQKVVWALPRGTPKELAKQLREFVAKAEQDGTLRRTFERYYGHIKQLDDSDIAGILARRSIQLPKYKKLFQKAHEETGIDWRLLAAIAYQESQWNPYAVSPTGVKGLMMLTGDTADRMGVTDRLDPRQSILAAARYLVMLKDGLPARIPEPDRTWMALAAYNQGMGHLEDARRLTRARKMDPDCWADLKKNLPLLARGRYARATKYGYSRGGEAVTLVESIRNYYDILSRFEQPFKPPLVLTKNAGSQLGNLASR